jgi:hypothetical protein
VEPLPATDSDVVLSVRGVSKKFCRSLKKSLWYGVQGKEGRSHANNAWIAIHQDELMADWQLAKEGQTPFKIEPLR